MLRNVMTSGEILVLIVAIVIVVIVIAAFLGSGDLGRSHSGVHLHHRPGSFSCHWYKEWSFAGTAPSTTQAAPPEWGPPVNLPQHIPVYHNQKPAWCVKDRSGTDLPIRAGHVAVEGKAANLFTDIVKSIIWRPTLDSVRFVKLPVESALFG